MDPYPNSGHIYTAWCCFPYPPLMRVCLFVRFNVAARQKNTLETAQQK